VTGPARRRAVTFLVTQSVLPMSGCSRTSTPSRSPDDLLSPSLSSVACISQTSCIAVGVSTTGSAFSELWDGRTWKALPTPGPPGSIPSKLEGVSCTSTTACMAVGISGQSGTFQPLSESWNGTRWTIELPQEPTGSVIASLSSVDCVSSEACLATGAYQTAKPASVVGPLFESWDATRWALLPGPSMTDWAALAGLSCTTATACVLTANQHLSNSFGALSWNGRDWASEAVASPSGVRIVQMTAITCRTSVCVAVGTWGKQFTANVRSLAERWNGKRWSILPTPADLNKQLASVSCPTSKACVAVGYAGPYVLAESWNGHRWLITPAQSPGRNADLVGVSCVSATACMDVGSPAIEGALSEPLAEWWNGKRWSLTQS
jgi:hypothetical protein